MEALTYTISLVENVRILIERIPHSYPVIKELNRFLAT